jgi:hypothetical protein
MLYECMYVCMYVCMTNKIIPQKASLEPGAWSLEPGAWNKSGVNKQFYTDADLLL